MHALKMIILALCLPLATSSCGDGKNDQSGLTIENVKFSREQMFAHEKSEPHYNYITFELVNKSDKEIEIKSISKIDKNPVLKLESASPSEKSIPEKTFEGVIIKPNESDTLRYYLEIKGKSGPITVAEPFTVSYKILPNGPVKTVKGNINGSITWTSMKDLEKTKLQIVKIISGSDDVFAYKVKNDNPYDVVVIGIRTQVAYEKYDWLDKYIDPNKSTCLDNGGRKPLIPEKECEIWLNVPKDKQADFKDLQLGYRAHNIFNVTDFKLK